MAAVWQQFPICQNLLRKKNHSKREKIEQRILNTCIWYHIFRTVLHDCKD
jgi:hypothetical protein